jgi:hypothetical protein
MEGDDDQLAVVIAPDTAEEAGRWLTTLRAAGFHPSIDYSAAHDRQGKFPVLVSPGEADEARGFLRGLRSAQATQAAAQAQPAVQPAPGPAARPAAIAPAALQAARPAALPSWNFDRVLPLASRALALVTGLLVIAGGLAVLASMLQFLSALRNH